MPKAVLIDTCFLIKLLNQYDPMHLEAKKYFEFFLNTKIPIYISTISIAEYCTKGKIEDIPLRQMKILPFNWNHAVKAGEFAATVFRQKNTIKPRNIIPNDSKLFAQAHSEESIECFITSDIEGKKVYDCIRSEHTPNFHYWDINIPLNERIGELGL